ncbi:hypothetical protein B566_EDAN015384 [Ephemera danica]|nr:hypothetical protein B566_EDAN015384 [Ephemera danica]
MCDLARICNADGFARASAAAAEGFFSLYLFLDTWLLLMMSTTFTVSYNLISCIEYNSLFRCTRYVFNSPSDLIIRHIMTHLAAQALNSFTDVFDKYGDPRVQGWLLMSSPLPTLAICMGYVYLVKVIGPKFMENRKPFELRKVLIWYNAFQVVFSAWIFYEMVHCCWWYYFSKFTEFFDTIFFVMRKKTSQVSTLHVVHHGIMPITFFGLLNTFVHIFMYFYYMVAAMGPQYQKFIWWKKYLTSLQMVQFIAIMVHAFQLLVTDCNYPRAFVWWIGMHAVLFFYLFSDFYNNTYKTNKERAAARKQQSMAQSFAKYIPCNLPSEQLHSENDNFTNSNGTSASSYYVHGGFAPGNLLRRKPAETAVLASN